MQERLLFGFLIKHETLQFASELGVEEFAKKDNESQRCEVEPSDLGLFYIYNKAA